MFNVHILNLFRYSLKKSTPPNPTAVSTGNDITSWPILLRSRIN